MSAPDWFALGLHESLAQGLDQVLRLEESKIQFLRCLKQALANPIPHAPDRIRILHEDIRTLDKTLRLRLGILPLDRSQAWFRHSPANEKGPIPFVVLDEPVFLRFEESRAQIIRQTLPELWRLKVTASEVYDPGYSIWGRLLVLGKKLRQLSQLPAPFQDIALDELPEALPDELSSPALVEFCERIKTRLAACERDLEACYLQLWTRSEAFLTLMHQQHMRSSSARYEGDWQTSKSLPRSPQEEALRFMSFSRLPTLADLRQRYRNMAQAHHPDRGGNHEHFQKLTEHYQALLKQIQRFTS